MLCFCTRMFGSWQTVGVFPDTTACSRTAKRRQSSTICRFPAPQRCLRLTCFDHAAQTARDHRIVFSFHLEIFVPIPQSKIASQCLTRAALVRYSLFINDAAPSRDRGGRHLQRGPFLVIVVCLFCATFYCYLNSSQFHRTVCQMSLRK